MSDRFYCYSCAAETNDHGVCYGCYNTIFEERNEAREDRIRLVEMRNYLVSSFSGQCAHRMHEKCKTGFFKKCSCYCHIAPPSQTVLIDEVFG